MVPSTKKIDSFSYRPDIDGLRAISIVIVTIFHLNLNYLPTGRIGVDVFFVISGYLITSILFKEHSRGTYSLKKFYVRRVKRIFPVLFISLAVFLAVAFLFFKEGVKYMAEHVIGSLLMAMNFWRLRN
jgi:peptidoglycan/LPS O-acetylase OafA/YrhL